MIELFARTEFPLREPNVLTPIHIDDDIASYQEFFLSANIQVLLECGIERLKS